MLPLRTFLLAGLALIAFGLGPAGASATIVYDNTATDLGSFAPGAFEHGDEITLAGIERTVVSFEFLYQLSSGQGDETARVRFYANDGTGGEPGSVLYDSGAVSIPVTGGPFAPLTLSGLAVTVPDSFTWTVAFDGTGESVLNRRYDPPGIGSSDNTFYWRRTGAGTWATGSFAAEPTSANFYARIDAVPEPTTAMLLGLGLAGLAFGPRRNES